MSGEVEYTLGTDGETLGRDVKYDCKKKDYVQSNSHQNSRISANDGPTVSKLGIGLPELLGNMQ